MNIAGRCACGQTWERIVSNLDEHLQCFRLRWCRVCGDLAVLNGDCPACAKRYRAIYRKKHGRPKDTPAKRATDRRRKALQRRLGLPQYEREKARKRLRYATDPVHAEAKRQAQRLIDKRNAADHQGEGASPRSISANPAVSPANNAAAVSYPADQPLARTAQLAAL